MQAQEDSGSGPSSQTFSNSPQDPTASAALQAQPGERTSIYVCFVAHADTLQLAVGGTAIPVQYTVYEQTRAGGEWNRRPGSVLHLPANSSNWFNVVEQASSDSHNHYFLHRFKDVLPETVPRWIPGDPPTEFPSDADESYDRQYEGGVLNLRDDRVLGFFFDYSMISSSSHLPIPGINT